MAPARVNIDQLIQHAETASPLGVVLQKMIALLNDPASDAQQLARVIQLDETLTGLVLRLANSAHVAPMSRISSVRRAVAQLGHAQLKPLLFSAVATSFLDTPLPAYGLERGTLWTHALGMATGARFLTAGHSVTMAEAAYTAGLLADIGMLTLDPLLPRGLTAPLRPEDERRLVGIDHAALGAEVARRWRLPDSVIAAIAGHHEPGAARPPSQVAAALHLIDICLMRQRRPDTAALPDPAALQAFNLDEARLDRLYGAIQPLIQSAKAALGN